ncbi:invasion associated locus B family protein [Geminicoccaceae bacterium 1502E]|nr:invasion associated locus B family protein [Geminicoccaceae bacterium 1502E]
MMLRYSLAALGAALLLSQPASAAFVESFRDWSLYVHEEKAEKVCFISSVPSKEEGDYTRRDQPRVFVTKFPAPPPNVQVMVDPGYPYLAGSNVDLVIDGTSFQMFTRDSNAWANSPKEDAAIIEAMKAGRTMTARGTSQKNTYSLDTYSLLGFTAAFRAMQDTCKDGKS